MVAKDISTRKHIPTSTMGFSAGAPAFNWDRFIPSENYGQIVMNQEVGAPISSAKLNAVTSAAIAACDVLDGIADGVIQEPRACTYNAKSFVCGKSNDPNCLTPAEASAVNKIWQGPPNPGGGQQRWFGLERGTPLTSLNGTNPFSISTDHLKYWVYQDPSFDWHTLTETTFNDAFYASMIKFHDVIGTDDPDLSAFRQRGGKMIMCIMEAPTFLSSRAVATITITVQQTKPAVLRMCRSFTGFSPMRGTTTAVATSINPMHH